jgi:protein-disulfide isomerase-like protein with CxxC motif
MYFQDSGGQVNLYGLASCNSITLYHSSNQLHEEEELKRQEREAKLFADLGAQGVPTFGLEVRP